MKTMLLAMIGAMRLMLLISFGQTLDQPPTVGYADAYIRHTGLPGETYAVEQSFDLINWTLTGRSIETPPGAFNYIDRTALFNDFQFYRIASGVGPTIFDWMGDAALNNRDGMEANPIPIFAWRPFPTGPGTTYKVEVFELFHGGNGLLAAPETPLASISGLAVTFWQFGPLQPDLAGGGNYGWRVTAVRGLRSWQSSMFQFLGCGERSNDESSPIVLPTPRDGPRTDWAKVIKLLNELAAKKKDAADALAANPSVQEVKLIEELMEMLKNGEPLRAILNKLLSGDTASLNDPAAVIKALCFLEKALEFVGDHGGKRISDKNKEKLKAFKEAIARLKKELEEAADQQEKLTEILEDLKNLITELSKDGGDPAAIIKDIITSRLFEKIREMLVKKLGEKAAGALISVIQDLINLGGVLISIAELEDLCREYNRILLAAIAGDTSGPLDPSRKLESKVDPSMINRNCQVRYSYRKLCYKATPGGGPNDGHLIDHPVPFSDGETVKESPLDSLVAGIGADGRICIKKTFELSPAGLACPPGEGPCLVVLDITYICGTKTTTVRIQVGVIKC